MASRTTRPNGDTHIYVKCANGKRRAVRLGKLTERQAEEAHRRLDRLEQDHREGLPPDGLSLAWLETLGSTLQSRVIATGLIEQAGPGEQPKSHRTVGKLVAEWLTTLDVEPQTRRNYRQVTLGLVEYFGEDREVASIIPADGDKYRAWLSSDGRSRSTVSRVIGTARRVMEYARRLRWIADNPLTHLHRSGEFNEERNWYVTPELCSKLVELSTSPELGAMVALSRWASFRGPSEFQHLRWGDVDFAAETVLITAPKTKRYRGGSTRVAPLNRQCLDALDLLWREADEGAEKVLPTLGGANSSDLSQRLQRICRSAGVPLWPKPWINLRASCETDWQAEGVEIFQTAKWMGHSPEVALRHYNRVVKDRVADLPQSAPAKRSAPPESESKKRSAKRSTHVSSAEDNESS